MNTQVKMAMPFVLIFAAMVGLSIWIASLGGGEYHAQAAVITPVTQTGRGVENARIVDFFKNRVITSDTRVCADLAGYETLDLQYTVDAATANTTTVSLQQTNQNPDQTSPTPVYNAANTIATVVATDASTFSELPLFMHYNCVFADVINTNPITFTILGVAK